MAKTVVQPAKRRGDFGNEQLPAFRAIEHGFGWHARSAVIAIGLTGLYVTWHLDFWPRFGTASFWWMHAMVCLWLIFAVVLLTAEPFIRRRSGAGRPNGRSLPLPRRAEAIGSC